MPSEAPTTGAGARGRKTRVVIAKPGLDGHDRGAKVVARALREMEHETMGQAPPQMALFGSF